MKVRCWVILGGPMARSALPEERHMLAASRNVGLPPPNAAFAQPGDWFLWHMYPETAKALVLVCVDVPLS